eukprot:982163-Prorocentrum_minimum.AAC.1
MRVKLVLRAVRILPDIIGNSPILQPYVGCVPPWNRFTRGLGTGLRFGFGLSCGIEFGFSGSGFRDRVSGSGFRVQVRVRDETRLNLRGRVRDAVRVRGGAFGTVHSEREGNARARCGTHQAICEES